MTGFAQILSLGRRNKMVGIAEQYQYILRDESPHLNFGIDVINQIRAENPALWSSALQEGEELLRDTSHRVSNRLVAAMVGLTSLDIGAVNRALRKLCGVLNSRFFEQRCEDFTAPIGFGALYRCPRHAYCGLA